jgi:hypothetical protein
LKRFQAVRLLYPEGKRTACLGGRHERPAENERKAIALAWLLVKSLSLGKNFLLHAKPALTPG